MENLIKNCEQYQNLAVKDDMNVEPFTEFMKTICISDQLCISREHYLSLPNHEKEAMIKKYYNNMKSCTGGKKFIFCFLPGLI